MSSRRIGLVVLGIMILLAVGTTACSTAAPSRSESGAELKGREIKVYESPT